MAAYDLISSVVDRVAWKNRLLRVPALNDLRTHFAEARREAFVARHLGAGPAHVLLEEITGQGVAIVEDQFTILSGKKSRLVMEEVIAAGPYAWTWKPGRFLLESDDILLQNGDLYRLGLSEEILDLAENYVKEPCYYMGCAIKLEKVTPSVSGTRQWHLDIEDDRLFRLIIYLNDVSEGGGPFQFIRKMPTQIARQQLGYRSGYVADEQMAQWVATPDWSSVLGPAGTLVAFDGTQAFHRVQRPTHVERFSLTLTYSSRRPRQVLRPVRLRRASRSSLMSSLSDRQQACIPRARWT